MPTSIRRPVRDSRRDVCGVRISNPDRVVFPDVGVTKVQLAQFYERIAEWIVPHMTDRPLTLVRCPDGATGDCFYMKHSKVWAPSALRRVNIAALGRIEAVSDARHVDVLTIEKRLAKLRKEHPYICNSSAVGQPCWSLPSSPSCCALVLYNSYRPSAASFSSC